MAAEVVQFERPEPKPTRAENAHKKRRLEIIGKRMATARTPREKLEVALDYYRAVTSDHRVNQAKAEVATEHLADRLIASADQLANTIRRNR